MKKKDFICVSALFLLLVSFFITGSSAFGALTAQRPTPVLKAAHNGEIQKILPVLEEKIHDGKLLEKSKEKIYSMGDGEVRLVAALCEKISGGGDTISSDIAFLLVTTLIVLS